MLKSTEARKSEIVTTTNRSGGLGRGYLVNGTVWVTTGSVWAVKATEDVTPMVSYQRDGGSGYIKRAHRVLG